MKRFQVKFIALFAMLWFGVSSSVLGSEYDTIVDIPAGTSFWNVIGSSTDIKIKGQNWLPLWKDSTGTQRDTCIVTGCNELATKGGHIVLNSAYVKPKQAGATNSVYILPICSGHNHQSNTGVMTTSSAVKAVKLKNYAGQY